MDNNPFNHNPFGINQVRMSAAPDNKKGAQENLDIKVEIASEKDWEDYKRIRVEAIEKDPEVFGRYFKQDAPVERDRSDQEWKDDIKDSIIVLSRNGSEVIGVVKGAQEGGIWKIHSVYLNKDFQKRGIASQMLKIVLDEERKRGAKRVRLWVLSERKEPIKLYEKFGFKKVNPIRALPMADYNPKYFTEWQIMELDFPETDKK